MNRKVFVRVSHFSLRYTLVSYQASEENMAETATQPIIEAEADDYENDSALGDDATVGSTESIASSILKYRVENGRTYHAYKVHSQSRSLVQTRIWHFEMGVRRRLMGELGRIGWSVQLSKRRKGKRSFGSTTSSIPCDVR